MFSHGRGTPVRGGLGMWEVGSVAWVGHRLGRARLWNEIGAIVAFAPILGSVSSDGNTGTKICEQHMWPEIMCSRIHSAQDPVSGQEAHTLCRTGVPRA